MRVLKGKFASSVFQSCKEKTPNTRKLVSGFQCVNCFALPLTLYLFLYHFSHGLCCSNCYANHYTRLSTNSLCVSYQLYNPKHPI
jgi:hypothetical protein